MARTFSVKSTRGDTAERLTFIDEDYLINLAAELKNSAAGEAVLVGSEDGYTGGRDGGPQDGKGIASAVGDAVREALGKLTDQNTKVHAIKDPDGGNLHFAALSLNRSQGSYSHAKANPVKRTRKAKGK